MKINKPFCKKILFAAGLCTVFQLADAQISSDSLILHLPLDGNAIDISGNGNNGTPLNVVPDIDRYGNPNGSYRFNGSNATIEIPASPSINKIQTANEMSILAWVKRNNVSADVFAILERYDPALDASYILELNTYLGGIAFVGNASAPSPLSTCNYSNWTTSQWYQVGFTYSKAEGMARFYVDGVNVCSNSYSTDISINDSTASFWVGRSLTGPDEYSNGLIDDLMVFYRVLSDAEVISNYTSTKEKHLAKNISVSPNPAAEHISISNLPAGTDLYITDIMGKPFYQVKAADEQVSINTEGMENGLYFLRASNNGMVTIRKFLVNK